MQVEAGFMQVVFNILFCFTMCTQIILRSRFGIKVLYNITGILHFLLCHLSCLEQVLALFLLKINNNSYCTSICTVHF